MKKYLLDTGTVRRIGTNENVKKRYATLDSDHEEAYVSVLTLHEMYYGLSNARGGEYEEKARQAIDSVKAEFKNFILPITEDTAEIFGEIKSGYKEKTRINPENIKKHTVDFMLIATAINENAIFVTHDSIARIVQDFRTDLKWEDWVK